MAALKPFEQLVGRGGNVGEWDPGVLSGGELRPVYQVFVTAAKLACVENRLHSRSRNVIRNVKRNRTCVGMKLGRIVIGFEKGNMENRMETRKIRGETELVRKVGDCVVNGKGSESAMFELVGWACGLDMPSHEPYELVWLIGRGSGDALVVVSRLSVLSFTQMGAKLVVQPSKTVSEVSSGWHGGGDRDSGVEGRVVSEIGKKGRGVRGGIEMVVERKLGEGGIFDTVVLLRRNVGTEVCFERLVCTLREAVCLRVMRSRELELGLEERRELLPKDGDEGGAAVRDNGLRHTVVAEDAVEEDPGELGSSS